MIMKWSVMIMHAITFRLTWLLASWLLIHCVVHKLMTDPAKEAANEMSAVICAISTALPSQTSPHDPTGNDVFDRVSTTQTSILYYLTSCFSSQWFILLCDQTTLSITNLGCVVIWFSMHCLLLTHLHPSTFLQVSHAILLSYIHVFMISTWSISYQPPGQNGLPWEKRKDIMRNAVINVFTRIFYS